MTITTIVTALFIAAFFCLIVALLLTRAERKQTHSWQRPFRPAEPDTGDDEYPSQACMTAPRQHDTAAAYRAADKGQVLGTVNGIPVTKIVTDADVLISHGIRLGAMESDVIFNKQRLEDLEEIASTRIKDLEQDVKLLHRLRLNHAHRLTQCEDLIDLLNHCEQETQDAGFGLDDTQELPRLDVQGETLTGWTAMGVCYPDAVREIARWRIEAEEGRLDLVI